MSVEAVPSGRVTLRVRLVPSTVIRWPCRSTVSWVTLFWFTSANSVMALVSGSRRWTCPFDVPR
ncbi:hypothetical protein D3C72_2298580 [compost metagenome]